ncbi:prephenate dehydratase [Dasania sp. GY-MA-18]|uniref:Bifunctional chorismate mutase/prephenate dehydratase n=1 Tax=Dasania phycosphaerae TaxID=2950436 RepID=A0A9J6RRX2_9GAMM|nr:MULTISPECIES: prephenate dehydratase [Dasania]MCR8924258.1 prephenate dehydratase [Dasania sp. GY-MA-18]MCZ0866911.1 prephenate dehydratase [Dasania phycosphaerae]MCZ0870415.1 prephenate dehydratase [Dasania phycosphaerae]
MSDDKQLDEIASLNTLDQLRKAIDQVDGKIHNLLNYRARLAERVAEVKLAELKAETGEADLSKVMFYRPEREAQVLQKVIDRNTGPLPDKTVAHLFREIMSACLALEKPMEVAYLGPEGTFTQAAAMKHFGHGVIAMPQPEIANVFAQVESGQCNYGVVPVENSTEGMVNHTLDNFIDSPLKICGEVALRIELHLLVCEGASAQTVKTICAHRQALAQCRQWLDNNWPGVERLAVSSNAEAARMAKDDPTIAAVAGDIAAEKYGLMKLASSIEDLANNTTRFLIIGREDVPAGGNDKTSLIISAHNKPGALLHLLTPFEQAGISLTRIDTRPSRTQNWAYLFFVEFEGHQQEPRVKAVLDNLIEQSVMLKVLGSYPAAVL